jgi:hypothetical protein
MRGATPPLPQYVFTVWCLVEHRDNFTFTFTFTDLKELGCLTCSYSKLTSETITPFRHFGRTSRMMDRPIANTLPTQDSTTHKKEQTCIHVSSQDSNPWSQWSTGQNIRALDRAILILFKRLISINFLVHNNSLLHENIHVLFRHRPTHSYILTASSSFLELTPGSYHPNPLYQFPNK